MNTVSQVFRIFGFLNFFASVFGFFRIFEFFFRICGFFQYSSIGLSVGRFSIFFVVFLLKISLSYCRFVVSSVVFRQELSCPAGAPLVCRIVVLSFYRYCYRFPTAALIASSDCCFFVLSLLLSFSDTRFGCFVGFPFCRFYHRFPTGFLTDLSDCRSVGLSELLSFSDGDSDRFVGLLFCRFAGPAVVLRRGL